MVVINDGHDLCHRVDRTHTLMTLLFVLWPQNRFYLHGNAIASLQTCIPVLLEELR
jgi:hypothetical protein